MISLKINTLPIAKSSAMVSTCFWISWQVSVVPFLISFSRIFMVFKGYLNTMGTLSLLSQLLFLSRDAVKRSTLCSVSQNQNQMLIAESKVLQSLRPAAYSSASVPPTLTLTMSVFSGVVFSSILSTYLTVNVLLVGSWQYDVIALIGMISFFISTGPSPSWSGSGQVTFMLLPLLSTSTSPPAGTSSSIRLTLFTFLNQS